MKVGACEQDKMLSLWHGVSYVLETGTQEKDVLLAVEVQVRCDDTSSSSHMNKAVVVKYVWKK